MKFIDIFSSVLSREVYDSNWISLAIHHYSDIALSTVQSFAGFPSAQLTIIEARNKLTAFHYFRNPNIVIAPVERVQMPWAVYVSLTKKLDPFAVIWLLEGRAAWLVDQNTNLDDSVLDLALATSSAGSIAASRLPLYAGAGLTFARRVFDDAPRKYGVPDLSALVARLVDIAEKVAARTYQACLYEAAGLIARTIYPELITGLSRTLLDQYPQIFPWFWHGVGRGLYFNPSHLVPGLPVRDWFLDSSIASAPNTCARRNLLAGFFWAFTLVNIRHPEVITFFLNSRSVDYWKQHAPAISNGISAAILVWHHLTADENVTECFLAHVPFDVAESLRQFWVDQIVSCSRWRLHQEYRNLLREDRIADIFQYQEL